MDDLIDRVARAIYEAQHVAGPIGDEPIEWGRGGYKTQVVTWQAAAKAIIPLVYEDAAMIAEHGFGEDPVAEAIRSRSMAIVGES